MNITDPATVEQALREAAYRVEAARLRVAAVSGEADNRERERLISHALGCLMSVMEAIDTARGMLGLVPATIQEPSLRAALGKMNDLIEHERSIRSDLCRTCGHSSVRHADGVCNYDFDKPWQSKPCRCTEYVEPVVAT